MSSAVLRPLGGTLGTGQPRNPAAGWPRVNGKERPETGRRKTEWKNIRLADHAGESKPAEVPRKKGPMGRGCRNKTSAVKNRNRVRYLAWQQAGVSRRQAPARIRRFTDDPR